MYYFAWYMDNNSTTKQYLIKLVLNSQFHSNEAWTDKEFALAAGHFDHLKRLKAEGRLIIAGRTQEPHEHTFGIMIFTADNDEQAQAVLDEDPAVIGGLMIASLHPYHVALMG